MIYDPKDGDPDSGIAPGTPFDDIPEDWVCTICGARKSSFVPYRPVDLKQQPDGWLPAQRQGCCEGRIDAEGALTEMNTLGHHSAGQLNFKGTNPPSRSHHHHGMAGWR